ncbi:serine hydrolase domain-containing protein [Actinoplanes sp. NPDC049668]|uniref:serine hydrolase domain-containing protein n=1 Tax=unclassified Actinoplanes TaxID=2626549 RepID=UPI0033B7A3F3
MPTDLAFDDRKLTTLPDFSGAIRIEQAGREVYRGSFGLANRAWQVHNDQETRFRVASISKMFTAVAVLRLVEQGQFGLGDRIGTMLDLSGTTLPAEVTVEQLLTMTSGIADWFDESGDWEKNWAELIRRQPIYLLRRHEDYLPLFAHEPPLSAPGERYSYNGAGYLLLGMLIERITGDTYFDHIRRHVFEPAGMHGAGFVALDDVEPHIAEGYLPPTDADGAVTGWKRNIYSTTPEGAADGGATCTTADLIAFNRALRGGLLLGQELTSRMLTPQVKQQDERTRGYTWKYSYGVMFILDDHDTVVRWGHTGEEDGVSARLYHYPGLDVDVAILGNHSWCAGKLAWEIHDSLIGAAAPA